MFGCLDHLFIWSDRFELQMPNYPRTDDRYLDDIWVHCSPPASHHCGVEMLSPECESVTFYRAISAKVPQSWGVRLPFKQTESLTNKMWGSSSSGKRIQHHITATVLFIINYCHYHYIYIITISSSWSGKPRAAGSPQQSCPASAAAPRPADSPAAVEWEYFEY